MTRFDWIKSLSLTLYEYQLLFPFEGAGFDQQRSTSLLAYGYGF
jgi:hypothetical protein